MTKNTTSDLGAFGKIERATVFDQVYEALRTQLMAGRFKPGQKLTSRGVAEAMGVSDMPVRAALNRLVTEGGLVQRSNGTTVVPTVNRERFREVMALRALLERRATEYATPNFERRGIATLRKLADEIDEAAAAHDIVRHLDANQRLKFAIYSRCNSPMLQGFIETVWLQAGPYLRQLDYIQAGAAMSGFHNEAVDAIATGDAAAAGFAIENDILDGMNNILVSAKFPDTAKSSEEA